MQTTATVGTATARIQAQVALAADGHAKGTVTEHFNADALTVRTADVFFIDGTSNLRDLLHVEFASQNDHVGKLGIKAQGFHVGNIQLRGKVHFLTDRSAVVHHSDVASDDGRNLRFFRGIDDLAHQFDVFVVDDRVDRQIAFDVMLATNGGDFFQIMDRECFGRMSTHVQVFDTEINGIGTGLNGGSQRIT